MLSIPILGQVRNGTHNEHATDRHLLQNVPEPPVGTVALRAVIQRSVRTLAGARGGV